MSEYKFLPTLMWKYNYEEGFDLKPFKDCLDRTGIRGHYESDGGLTTAGMGENPHEWPSLVPFLTWLQPKIELTLNEWCINWNQYHITKSWVNSHLKGGHTRTHDHGNTHIVVSCYIKQPENSGHVEFENILRHHWVPYMRKDESKNMHDYYSVVPIKQNDIIIFPGFLSHHSQVSNSDEERLVYTINYFVN
mgnify:CR=1 FL=1